MHDKLFLLTNRDNKQAVVVISHVQSNHVMCKIQKKNSSLLINLKFVMVSFSEIKPEPLQKSTYKWVIKCYNLVIFHIKR